MVGYNRNLCVLLRTYIRDQNKPDSMMGEYVFKSGTICSNPSEPDVRDQLAKNIIEDKLRSRFVFQCKYLQFIRVLCCITLGKRERKM